MNLRSLGLALAAGLAAFVGVGVAVTELVAPQIEFSLFVGLPAGVVAGALVAGATYLGFAEDAPAGRRRVAATAGAFGLAFLVALLAATVLLGSGVVIGMVLATAAAAVVAAAAYLRPPPGVPSPQQE